MVRRAAPGETLTTLDGVERRLDPEDLLIASPEGPLALAGIMGGESSEVRPQTTRVFLEVAHFAAPGVLLSGKRHGLRSEAGARFERGVDPALPPIVSARAARLMADLGGGEVAGGFIDHYPAPDRAGAWCPCPGRSRPACSAWSWARSASASSSPASASGSRGRGPGRSPCPPTGPT